MLWWWISLNQQQQQRPGTCKKCKFSCPTLGFWNQKLELAQQSVLRSFPGDCCMLTFENHCALEQGEGVITFTWTSLQTWEPLIWTF